MEGLEQKPLELRAYFFVPYNISEIQKGVQSIHAAFRYGRKFAEDENFKNFVDDNNETVIILDGGTTNNDRDFDGIAAGTLNQIGEQLAEKEISFTYFHEPDLNHALTALCFICDERVFNRTDYPDFVDYLVERIPIDSSQTSYETIKLKMMKKEELITAYDKYYKEWIRLIGGVKNEFLRELIRDKNLA